MLERYPQLRGFLQPKRRISEKSLYAKLRKFFREGKIPDHIINEDPPEFYRSNGALDGAFIEYKLGDPRIQNHDIVSIVEYLKTRILRLIETHPNTKIYLSIHVTMFQRSSGETEMKGLRTGAQEFLIGTNPETVFETCEIFYTKGLRSWKDQLDLGWTLVRTEYLTMKFAEYRVAIGSSFKPLPEKIRKLRAIINIQNDDQKCFMHSVTRALNPVSRALNLVSRDGEPVTKKLREQKKLDWEGVNFPTPLQNIDIFENVNKVSVMVLGWNEDSQLVEYFRTRKPNTRRSLIFFYTKIITA